jgi:hypothetical protein
MSIEQLLAWVGIELALLYPLIDVEDPRWRIAILVAAGLVALHIVRKIEWVNQPDQILSLNGESPTVDAGIFSRKLRGYMLVVLVFTLLGFGNWSPKRTGVPGDGVILAIPAASQIEYHPTEKGILPNAQRETDSKMTAVGVLGGSARGTKPVMLRPNAPFNLTIAVH